MTTTTRPSPAIKPATPAQLTRYFEAKLAAELGPHNVKRLLDLGGAPAPLIVDVRARDGYAKGRLPGAVSIPFEELPGRLRELPKNRELIVYCWDTTCILSTKAAYVLASRGYRVKEMIGGIEQWEASGFPIER